MEDFGKKGKYANLEEIGLKDLGTVNWNLSPAELVEDSIILGEGILTHTGALAIETGAFTGRSPKDKFVVKDANTENSVWWGSVNNEFSEANFDALYDKMKTYLVGKDVYARESFACADERFRLNIRVITETPWANQFASNMFLRPTDEEIEEFKADWHIVCIPSFSADPKTDGTKAENFSILNMTKKMILIGGSGYTGEIKKGIFAVLNYILPHEKNVLSMHCSANIGESGDTAIFFGLSGTGKTTLSSDPNRRLIGDDEHGWSDTTVFNFEGGCYAKMIRLSPEAEPEIFATTKRFGTVLENVVIDAETRELDFDDASLAENSRGSYPIDFIPNASADNLGPVPRNVIMLTADAYGVLPPIARLTPEQAMYHFLSGYTARVAGTEIGVTEPEATFSTCFGAPFMPRHPSVYGNLLKERIAKGGVQCWLVNTGWTGGKYGVGNRMPIKATRALLNAAIDGSLNSAEYRTDANFGFEVPIAVEGVDSSILDPRSTWADKDAYDATAQKLVGQFVGNFAQFADHVDEAVNQAAPIAA